MIIRGRVKSDLKGLGIILLQFAVVLAVLIALSGWVGYPVRLAG